jgi:hypothetical protein
LQKHLVSAAQKRCNFVASKNACFFNIRLILSLVANHRCYAVFRHFEAAVRKTLRRETGLFQ